MHGYHINKDILNAVIGEELQYKTKLGNRRDPICSYHKEG